MTYTYYCKECISNFDKDFEIGKPESITPCPICGSSCKIDISKNSANIIIPQSFQSQSKYYDANLQQAYKKAEKIQPYREGFE